MSDCTRDEWMTVVAARMLRDRCVCFVGIGLPSAACNLARLTHAPDIVLIYESGTIGARPQVLPLSIGDGELAETASCVVPLPELFNYYLQAGRVDVGFLGAAQIDRHGNLNSTVIGPYGAPSTRLPGAGGAPEIALHARETFVMLKATPRSFVERLDFRTTAGHCRAASVPSRNNAGREGVARAPRDESSHGPSAVITDFGVLTPRADSGELSLSGLFGDASVAEARAAVGWPLGVADQLEPIAPPSAFELETLRGLQARTRAAYALPVSIPA
ncbi:CoA-transferase subunit beta [Dokdonella immobilis]|uniref:Glutaconate CoA-transferase subunit B n=1 Tax=Dokdonella immobilis TaxID=578942 RepID=A0A1I4X2G8_9GAMM|nr:CoA-transferase [Dokdonella immobilis]SFN19855.1 glutaconate CoA-transferase subunit B [Dokdonella immobilis]